MYKLAITYRTEEQIKMEEQILIKFQKAFKNKNTREIHQLLDKKGRFFSNKSFHGALALFYSYFKKVDVVDKLLHVVCNGGYTNDHKPCQPVLEFRFPDYNPFSSNNDDINLPFGAKPNKKRNEIVFRFAFEINEEKIVSIRIPNSCTASFQKEIRMN